MGWRGPQPRRTRRGLGLRRRFVSVLNPNVTSLRSGFYISRLRRNFDRTLYEIVHAVMECCAIVEHPPGAAEQRAWCNGVARLERGPVERSSDVVTSLDARRSATGRTAPSARR